MSSRHARRSATRRGSAALAGLVIIPSAALVAPTAADAGTAVAGPHVTTVYDDSSPVEGGAQVMIVGHGFTGATAVDFGTVAAGSFTVENDGAISATAPPAPAPGPVEITVTTPVGTSTLNPGDVFTYMSAPVVDPTYTSTGSSPAPVTLSGYGLTGTTQVLVGGMSVTPVATTDQNVSFLPPARTADGTVGVSVKSAAGSSTGSSPLSSITYDSSPVIQSVTGYTGPDCLQTCFSGTAGALAGGKTFYLAGSGFSGATAVSFGGVTLTPGQFTVDGDGAIIGTVPAAQNPGPVDIRVTTPGGTSPIDPEDVWFYDPAAAITGGTGGTTPPTVTVNRPLSIWSGLGIDSAPAGYSLTLTGTGFDPATSVYFGTVPAAGVTYNSATSLTVAVPANLPPGTVPITVSDSNGTSAITSNALFTSAPAPVVLGVYPDAVTGAVYVNGSGLSGASAVSFAGVAASDVQVVNDQGLEVTPPASVSSGDVTVTTPGGTSAINPRDAFGFAEPPATALVDEDGYRTILSVSPPGGGAPFSGGVQIPVGASKTYGIDFGTTALTSGLGTITANDCAVECSANVSSKVPAGDPGPVAVTAVDGTSRSVATPHTIWYYGPDGAGQAPVVTGLDEVALYGSGELDIYGSGFTGATSVQVGGTQLTGTALHVFNDDAMSVAVPAGLTAGTVDVTVTTPDGTSAATTDDLLQVGSAAIPPPAAPAPPSGVTSSSSQTVTGSTATATSANPTTGTSVAATATGTGGVTVATYAKDPEPSAPPGATGGYVDVKVSSGQSLDALAVTVCGLSPNQILEYFDGTSWQTMSPQQADDPAAGCDTAELDNTSSTPRISDLTGTAVAVVNAAPAGAPPSTAGLAGRIAGNDAEGTAVASLESRFPTWTCVPSRTVVLATDSTYPDALAASYLAGQLGTGVLLTGPGSLSPETAQAIAAEGIQKVVIVGGTDAVSSAVANQLSSTPATSCGGGAAAGDISVSRMAGTTQYATAAQIATSQSASTVGQLAFPDAYGRYNDTSGAASATGPASAVPTAIVASGAEFQDATAASPLAYAGHVPVLLTDPSALPAETSAALQTLAIKQVVLLGGPAAVSDGVVTALEGLGISVLRIAGLDYGDTSSQLARFELGPAGAGLAWHETASTGAFDVALTRGDGYADALTSSEVTGAAMEPVLLATDAGTLGSAITSFFQQAGTSGGLGSPDRLGDIQPFGGTLALSDATVQAAVQAAGG